MFIISAGVAFVLTWLFGFKDKKEDEAATAPENNNSDKKEVPALQCKSGVIYAPVNGKVFSYEQIPDQTFAAGILGKGVGIEPEVGEVVAPFDGEISSVTDTKHAVAITSPDGMEVLIHVGVDTVAMKGDGFNCLVKEGQKVKAGEKLITFDREKIKKAGHPDCVVVLLTNCDDYSDFKLNTGSCKLLDQVITV